MRNLVKTSFFIMLVNMKWNLPLILTLVAISLIFIRFSIVLLFFGISLPAFIILYYCMRAFKNYDSKKQELAE